MERKGFNPKQGISKDTLKPGNSRETISQNIKTERASGKSERQSIAIALNKARESK